MIFSPLTNIKKVVFVEDSSGDAIIYTTEYTCMVAIQITSATVWDTSNEFIRVYHSPPSGSDSEGDLYTFGGTTSPYEDTRRSYTTILPAGINIRVQRSGESVAGIIHVFRITDVS